MSAGACNANLNIDDLILFKKKAAFAAKANLDTTKKTLLKEKKRQMCKIGFDKGQDKETF